MSGLKVCYVPFFHKKIYFHNQIHPSSSARIELAIYIGFSRLQGLIFCSPFFPSCRWFIYILKKLETSVGSISLTRLITWWVLILLDLAISLLTFCLLSFLFLSDKARINFLLRIITFGVKAFLGVGVLPLMLLNLLNIGVAGSLEGLENNDFLDFCLWVALLPEIPVGCG